MPRPPVPFETSAAEVRRGGTSRLVGAGLRVPLGCVDGRGGHQQGHVVGDRLKGVPLGPAEELASSPLGGAGDADRELQVADPTLAGEADLAVVDAVDVFDGLPEERGVGAVLEFDPEMQCCGVALDSSGKCTHECVARDVYIATRNQRIPLGKKRTDCLGLRPNYDNNKLALLQM